MVVHVQYVVCIRIQGQSGPTGKFSSDFVVLGLYSITSEWEMLGTSVAFLVLIHTTHSRFVTPEVEGPPLSLSWQAEIICDIPVIWSGHGSQIMSVI